ncbi:Transcription elongation factor B polypeptide 3-like [Oopsacas minuta]|uniref:Transcription elongation factor B polypeptide 3-like n=1 Tax=Oopsacas minuta TaxID=111878 RepID=A0AAV7JUT2_9METZ|nr:Transcription elongation factor B polypeptide 3-like [Oopsacas minuta]
MEVVSDENLILYIKKVKSRIERIIDGRKKSCDKQFDLLKYIGYLSKVEISVDLFHETKIGYTLQLLYQIGGEIQSAVNCLVNCWMKLLNLDSSNNPLQLFGFAICEDSLVSSKSENSFGSFSERLSQAVNPTKARNISTPMLTLQDELNSNFSSSANIHDVLQLPLSKEIFQMPSLPDIPFPEPSTKILTNYTQRKNCTKVRCPSNSINQFISSNSRTKLYSGNTKIIFSLYELCLRFLEYNVHLITQIKFIDYEVIRPLLERISPNELNRIEELNPQFILMTDNIWKRNCQKTFKSGLSSKNVESWKNLYNILFKEKEEKLKDISCRISAKISREKPVNMMKILSDSKNPRRCKLNLGSKRVNRNFFRGNDSKSLAPLMKRTIQEFKERRLISKSKPFKTF